MRYAAVALAISLIMLNGCNGKGQEGAANASAPPEAAASTAASAQAPEASGTPVTVPTPTPNANLLDIANGTILRSYSPPQLDGMNDGNLGNAAEGIGSELPSDAKPPFVFTFELPGVATISGFSVDLTSSESGAPKASATIAVSTSSADSGFSDVGTATMPDTGTVVAIPANVQARWVRVTANQLFNSIRASGTIAPASSALNPTGIFIEDAVPDKNGAFITSGRSEDDSRARFVAVGPGLTATECSQTGQRATYVGQFAGRSWNATFTGNKDANPDKIRAVVNDDASIIAGRFGDGGGSSVVFMRTTEKPAYCDARTFGTGTHHYLVLDQDPIAEMYPVDASPALPGYTFSAIGAGMLDAASLNGQDGVITRSVCKLDDLLGPQQMTLLLQWIAAGHKLIVTSGGCYGSTGADFTWLPYPLTSSQGPESTNASLIQVENSALGTNDKNDAAHFVDTIAYVKAQNDLAATGPIKTTDPPWCGHFFVAKKTNLNGFVQSYATDAKGTIVYDGFSPGDNGNPQLQRIRQLELALPVPSDLPCTQAANEAFLLAPNQELTFSAGHAQTLSAPLQLLANQGYSGHVTLTSTGDVGAKITPSTFDIAGGVENVTVALGVTAATKPGLHVITVTANNGSGNTSRATIALTGTATIRKAAMAPHQRIRIYGIHFDYDSATIQTRSEPVIADLAALMRGNPAWHFEISGHTDSDGGASYNLKLSQRRAEAVVRDLETRYGIAKARLIAKGYGLSRPVASNATDAGKAQNRRVEVERLQ